MTNPSLHIVSDPVPVPKDVLGKIPILNTESGSMAQWLKC